MPLNKYIQKFTNRFSGFFFIIPVFFAAATLYLQHYRLAAVEAGIIIVLFIIYLSERKKQSTKLNEYIESLTYEVTNAKEYTIANFPLPITAFRIEDSRIIWGNDSFFRVSGKEASKFDSRITDIAPEFTGKWIMEGRTKYPGLVEMNGRKYEVHGNILRTDMKNDDTAAFMGVTYWVDVTEYEEIKQKYQDTRPVCGVIVVDNLEELFKNVSDRDRNDVRDAIEDKLRDYFSKFSGILRRYDRDRYLAFFDSADFEKMKQDRFSVITDIHGIESPTGIGASVSMGFGTDAPDYPEVLQFADMAAELALSRGGDQAVIKNRLNFEFFGGRGPEVERRTKVRSRVMANTLNELIKDSSGVIVMGHKYPDLDSLGAAVGICCLCRKNAIRCNIVFSEQDNPAEQLLRNMRKVDEYRGVFMTKREAMIHADGKTLLIVVDTNRPEQVEDEDLLEACNKVAVIDHHRVSATYIKNAALSFVEPYASSVCEMLAEILQETTEKGDILKPEAEALLSGIVLDTKNFTIRTGERTFDAAAYLRRAGADTTDVKKLLQNDMETTVEKYRILQTAELYRNIAIAVPEEAQKRVAIAQSADELLNISGVDAAVVVAISDEGGIVASARSIGEVNVQIIMEKLGGGGNRSAAAARMKDIQLSEAVDQVYRAIDDYLDNK